MKHTNIELRDKAHIVNRMEYRVHFVHKDRIDDSQCDADVSKNVKEEQRQSRVLLLLVDNLPDVSLHQKE